MSLPAIAFRTASFALTAVVAWLAYPVLAALVYLGLLVASAAGDLGPGGPLAGPVLVLLGAVAGAICVAVAAPAALASRVLAGLKGILAGSAVLIFLAEGATVLAWMVFDLSGNPLLAGAILIAAAAPAVVALALSDVVAGAVARLAGHARTYAAQVPVEG